MLLKAIALLLFLLGILVGGLWVLLEAANAIAAGADSVWYVALVLTLVPAVLLALIAFRSRTRSYIGLTVAAVALVVAVIVTYPSGSSSACPPGASDATGGVTVSSEDLGGALVDDTSAQTTAAGCS